MKWQNLDLSQFLERVSNSLSFLDQGVIVFREPSPIRCDWLKILKQFGPISSINWTSMEKQIKIWPYLVQKKFILGDFYYGAKHFLVIQL